MYFSLVNLSFNYGVGAVLAKNLEGLRDNYYFSPNNNNSVHLVLRILRAFLNLKFGNTVLRGHKQSAAKCAAWNLCI